MPTEPSYYYYGFWEANPKLWTACLKEVADKMVASGWCAKAGKFTTVQRAKALKLFRSKV